MITWLNLDRLSNTQIFRRIRHGVPEEELRSPIEVATIPVYCMCGLLLISVIFGFLLTDFQFDTKGLSGTTVALLSFIPCGMALRRFGHSQVGGAIEAIGIIGGSGLLTVFSLAMLSATNLPLADDVLIRADAVFGFSWIEFMQWFQDRSALLKILSTIYNSLQWQEILAICALFFVNHQRRAWVFITAWVMGLAITVIIFPFFPAIAALNYYNIAAQPGVHSADFVPWMESIRNGSLRIIDIASIRGIVTFPSFHASAAIYLIWAFWGIRWVRFPFAVVNLLMLVATIIIGGHYLVDTLGGSLIAILCIVISMYLVPSYRQPESIGLKEEM